MSWMNESCVAAADRHNAAQSAWDHSVASPDGYGRRDACETIVLPRCVTAGCKNTVTGQGSSWCAVCEEKQRIAWQAGQAAKASRSPELAAELAALPVPASTVVVPHGDDYGEDCTVGKMLAAAQEGSDLAAAMGNETYVPAMRRRADGTWVLYAVYSGRVEVVCTRK